MKVTNITKDAAVELQWLSTCWLLPKRLQKVCTTAYFLRRWTQQELAARLNEPEGTKLTITVGSYTYDVRWQDRQARLGTTLYKLAKTGIPKTPNSIYWISFRSGELECGQKFSYALIQFDAKSTGAVAAAMTT